MNFTRAAAIAAIAVAVQAQARTCTPPRFDELPASPPLSGNTVQISSANLVRMDVPGGFTKIGMLEGAMRVSYPDGRHIALDIDRGALLPAAYGKQPATVIRAMFEGSTVAGCKLLDVWGLHHARDRQRLDVGPLSIYIYTQYDMVRFDVLDARRTDVVVRGVARGLSQEALIQIVRTARTTQDD